MWPLQAGGLHIYIVEIVAKAGSTVYGFDEMNLITNFRDKLFVDVLCLIMPNNSELGHNIFIC